MTVHKKTNGSELILTLEGRLDTTSAPQVDAEIKMSLNGVRNLVFDCSGLEYISSAGLRVLLGAQKTMAKQGNMVIRNVNQMVADIFNVTGFNEILRIEGVND